MSVARQIVKQAETVFDVVGTSQIADGNKLLVLGLESTPERDLDEFGHLNGDFQMYGFEKRVKPKLKSLLSFIRSQGFSAQPVGRYGYPLKGEINLKEEAIRAGLGRRGKSTVVLHPKYGPRLRFIAVRTDAPLEPDTDSTVTKEENPTCKGCSNCIDACPVKALEPYHMPDTSICLSNISKKTEEGRSILCDLCLQLCPAGKDK